MADVVELILRLAAGDAVKQTAELGAETEKTAKAAKGNTDALKTTEQGLARLTESVTRLSPQLGALTGEAKALTSGLSYLASAGPAVGVALGAAAVAAGIAGAAFVDAAHDMEDANAAHQRVLDTQLRVQASIRDIRKLQLEAAGDRAALARMAAEDASGLTRVQQEIAKARNELATMDVGLVDQGKIVLEQMTGINLFAKTAWELEADKLHTLEGEASIIETSLLPAMERATEQAERHRDAAKDTIRFLQTAADIVVDPYRARVGFGLDMEAQAAAQTYGTAAISETGITGASVNAPSSRLGVALSNFRASRLGRGIGAGLGVTAGLASGDVGGLLSLGGPYGAAIGGLAQVGEMGAGGVRDTLTGFTDAFVAGLEALPEILGEVIPEFVEGFISRGIPALVEASPRIFAALIAGLADVLNPFNDGLFSRSEARRIANAPDGMVWRGGGRGPGGYVPDSSARSRGRGRRAGRYGATDWQTRDMVRRYGEFGTASSSLAPWG